MTIKQQGGIFGRKPTFSKVDVEGSDASSFDRTGSLGKIVTFNDDGSEVGAIGMFGFRGHLELLELNLQMA